jgi:NitT/TauT family transport system permease protein/sulfonate transport system permease protein
VGECLGQPGAVFAGFSLTVGLALPVAALFALMPDLERGFKLPLEFMRITPPLALIPLLILWLGIGEATKIAIIVLASFFPVYLNVVEGLKNTDPRLREMARTIDLTPWDTFRHVLLPSTLPAVITGLRIGFGYSWRALIGAELVAAAGPRLHDPGRRGTGEAGQDFCGHPVHRRSGLCI